ncbi:ATP-binding protein, partial [Planctomycetota bacterium]
IPLPPKSNASEWAEHPLKSTIITSQLPIVKWHDHIGDPTIADAICDRLIHNAHRIDLKGPSRRKTGKRGKAGKKGRANEDV